MNWTGGRLHRHSTANAPKHKHKKKGIRKPTQGPQQVPLFHTFAQTKAPDPDKPTPSDKDNQTSHQKQVSLYLQRFATALNQYNTSYLVHYDFSIFISKPPTLERLHSSRAYQMSTFVKDRLGRCLGCTSIKDNFPATGRTGTIWHKTETNRSGSKEVG